MAKKAAAGASEKKSNDKKGGDKKAKATDEGEKQAKVGPYFNTVLIPD